MNKQTYISSLENIKLEIQKLEEQKAQLRNAYIQSNKPCEVDQLVEIIKSNGKKITGVAKTFRILQDGNVYVDSINVGTTKKVYFSQPYKSIKVLRDE
jgi:hypothetical protein